MELNQTVQIIITLVFSALFSGVEIAFISADRMFIELQANKGARRDVILARLKNKPEMFIASLLVGNTLVLVLYGLLMARALEPSLNTWFMQNVPMSYVEISVMLSQTVISTLLVLATAEFLPKSLFLLNPYKILKVLIYPILVAYVILYPVVWVIVKLSRWMIVKVFKQDYADGKSVFGLTDLNNYLNEILTRGETTEDSMEVDTEMLNNAIEFRSVRLRDCMLPRTEIIAIEQKDSVDNLKKQFIETSCSRIIVYKESIDEVVGYVHHSKLFIKPEEIKEVVSDIIFAPETMLASELMIEFSQKRKSIALVVDEFGGTAGIVTVEDIIEEIFGEIEDEYDDIDLHEQQLDDNEWMLSGRHEVQYLNDKYNMGIPDGEYDTLSGFILTINADIPSVYQRIKHNEFSFIIKSMSGVRIDKVLVSINKMEEKLD